MFSKDFNLMYILHCVVLVCLSVFPSDSVTSTSLKSRDVSSSWILALAQNEAQAMYSVFGEERKGGEKMERKDMLLPKLMSSFNKDCMSLMQKCKHQTQFGVGLYMCV